MTDIDTSKSLAERIRIGMPPDGINAVEWYAVYSAARRLCGCGIEALGCQPLPTLAATMRTVPIKPPFVTFGEWDGLVALIESGVVALEKEPPMDEILRSIRRIFTKNIDDVGIPTQDHSDDGRKDDSGKDPWHLLPFDAIRAAVKVPAFSVGRYGARNWERGMAWSRCYAALLRHLTAWWEGERSDPDTGYSHLWHALCCCMFLTAFEIRGIGTDDRPIIQKAAQ
jgi:hypothetical protein